MFATCVFFRESYILWSFMAMYFGAVSCEGKVQCVLDVLSFVSYLSMAVSMSSLWAMKDV